MEPQTEHTYTRLNLQSNSTTLNMHTHLKIWSLTFDLNPLTTNTLTTWQSNHPNPDSPRPSETNTRKCYTQHIYIGNKTSVIWPPIVYTTNITQLQTTRDITLSIATGCTLDINIQHLYGEKTNYHHAHLKLHRSQIRQQSQHSTHTLHSLIKHTT